MALSSIVKEMVLARNMNVRQLAKLSNLEPMYLRRILIENRYKPKDLESIFKGFVRFDAKHIGYVNRKTRAIQYEDYWKECHNMLYFLLEDSKPQAFNKHLPLFSYGKYKIR